VGLAIVLCMLAGVKLPDMPAGKAQHACESCGNSIYVAAGGCDGLHVSTMYRYDFRVGAWSECAPAPSRVQSPVMRCVNGKLYFIGGHDSTKGAAGGKTPVCGEYDPDTDRWTLKTPMPTAREDMGSVVLGREIWVFGGLDNRGHYITSNVEVYDTATDTWTTREEWPNPRCLGDFACTDGRAVYLMSGTCTMDGYPDLVPSATPQVYEAGIFYDLPPMPQGHCYTEVELLDGIIYLFGGAVNSAYSACDTIDRFDARQRVWLSPLKMPYVANSVAATQHRGRLYVTGGWRDGQFLRDFYMIERPPVTRLEPPYAGGHGTAADPYRIATAEQLVALSNCPADWDKNFRLVADIDLADFNGVWDKPAFPTIAPDINWVQEGFQGTPFAGTFDGAGHTIAHLTVRGQGYVGLFGLLARSAEIRDLALVDANVTGWGKYAGSLAGFCQGTVDHCCCSRVVVSGSGAYLGGLLGSNTGLVTRCWSAGTVAVQGDFVGGLVGLNAGALSEGSADGLVGGRGTVGGLVGHNGRPPCDTRAQCRAVQVGTIQDCASRAAVRGEWIIGGLVGSNADEGIIYSSYSAGLVRGDQYVGGLVGLSGKQVVCSFWDTQTSGQLVSAGGTGLSADEMRNVRTFLDAGWDFAWETSNGTKDTWWLPAGGDYPRLAYKAASPKPYDGAADILDPPILRWAAGEAGVEHDVYFGEDEIKVASATRQDPGVYCGRQPAGATVYEPGSLQAGKTYYWRIDGVNTVDVNDPWKGRVWKFSTADYIPVAAVDDFESYTDDIDAGAAVFQTWIDGIGLEPHNPGNDTGSFVGNPSESFAEELLVHGGRQSMPLGYDNVKPPWCSQAERTWELPQDWTAGGADTLTLYFRGETGNDRDPLYVGVEDNNARVAVVAHHDTDAVLSTEWRKWHIPLADVRAAGADPGAVTRVYLGVGDRLHPGGRGRVYFDDICLTRRAR
jgi:hypothetical protein